MLILTGQEKRISREEGKYRRRHVVCIMADTGLREAICIVCCDGNHSVWEELPALRRRI
jgi:hypothetical protein